MSGKTEHFVIEAAPVPSDAIVDAWAAEVIAGFRDRGLSHEFFADFRRQADALKARLAGRKE
jgi:hypothetical protein